MKRISKKRLQELCVRRGILKKEEAHLRFSTDAELMVHVLKNSEIDVSGNCIVANSDKDIVAEIQWRSQFNSRIWRPEVSIYFRENE